MFAQIKIQLKFNEKSKNNIEKVNGKPPKIGGFSNAFYMR